jgi:hypothetical protein
MILIQGDMAAQGQSRPFVWEMIFFRARCCPEKASPALHTAISKQRFAQVTRSGDLTPAGGRTVIIKPLCSLEAGKPAREAKPEYARIAES